MKKIKFKKLSRQSLQSWKGLLQFAIENGVGMASTDSDANKLIGCCLQELHQRLDKICDPYNIQFTFQISYAQAIAFKLLVTRNRFVVFQQDEITLNQIIALIDQKTV